MIEQDTPDKPLSSNWITTMTDEYTLLEDRYFSTPPEQLREEILRISDEHTLHDSFSPEARYWSMKQSQLIRLLKERDQSEYVKLQADEVRREYTRDCHLVGSNP